ncbi:LysR family transcriptional regulator [Rhodocyclus tenuis]|uniref:DNA-binding transcriptional LysR family regulator n=1 Tax=Rhodocyclus tenuis TaxID=1066 RepID=A0A840GB44_RHOTE|nr:LysR family transcriptional regulator [Rhodocyclus tenuis]MBB4248691.1 DNA-binding transcriptional LysR family regulator [Rhodocyclus tenuis]MBK1680866.1 LysR family transcriptional regulator [Rhodocyclus tenuis]
MKITLRQLEIFGAIARTENVSRAAKHLHMSQSAASSALVELERLFDCPLFDRIGKSLHLNLTGRGLLPAVDALLAQAQDVETRLAGGRLGPLNVGATLTIGNYLATLLLAEYMQQHPESAVELHVANTDAIVERLLRFDCDVGLIEGDVSHPELLVERWLEDELVVFCAPGHALATAGSADNETLARQDWILRERGSGTRSQFDRIVAPQLATLKLRLELEHTEAIKRAVEAGLGIACLSRLALREALRRRSLIEIATPQFDMRRSFHFARHRQRHQSAAVAGFLQLCRELTRQAASTKQLPMPFTL